MLNLRTILLGARAARGFVFGVLFVAAGLFLIGTAAIARNSIAQEMRAFLPAAGEVIGSAPVRSSRNNSTTYAAEVRFVAQDGKSYNFRESVSSNPPSHKIGDMVNVLYDPGNPSKARVDDFVNTWLFPLLLGGMGLLFALIGGSIVLSGIRAGIAAAIVAARGF